MIEYNFMSVLLEAPMLAAATAATNLVSEAAASGGSSAAVHGWRGYTLTVTHGWFDFVVVGFLIAGFFLGRKRGMSGELVGLLCGLIMVVLPGLYYQELSALCTKYLNVNVPWANLLAYGAILFVVLTVFGVVKKKMGDKLVSGDLFGRSEYPLGAMAGVLRFACYAVVLFSLVYSRPTSREQAVANAKKAEEDKKQGNMNLSPNWSGIQVAIVIDSFFGANLAKNFEEDFLLKPVNYSVPFTQTPGSSGWQGKEKDPTDVLK